MMEETEPLRPSTPDLLAALRVELRHLHVDTSASWSKVARSIGVHPGTLSGWLTGKCKAEIRVDVLFDLLAALGGRGSKVIARAEKQAGWVP